MKLPKISIVGCGSVGSQVAYWLALRNLADLVLIDIDKGTARGKSLDLSQSLPILHSASPIKGSSNYADTKNSDIIIITAGLPRMEGMSRDDLLEKNCSIIRQIIGQTTRYARDAIYIIVTNPLDAMVYAAKKVGKISANKIIGMAGTLDSARFRYFVAQTAGVAPEDVSALVLGGHGDLMIPMEEYCTIGSVPVSKFISKKQMTEIIHRVQYGGGEIVSLLKKSSASFAPAAAIAELAEAIIQDKKRVLPVSAYLNGEYKQKGIFLGVPCIIGKNGVERIIQIPLSQQKQKLFSKTANQVKQLVQKVDELLK